MTKRSNRSKTISGADDSAALLLIDLLDGDHTRGFDIESIFLERKDNGSWYFRVFEFLKAETIPPKASHPNYYWHKNSRKFLSLWTLVQVIRQANFKADLLLLNYDDARTDVKIMKVLSIDPSSEQVIRQATIRQDGKEISEVRNWVKTEDTVMPFANFKEYFRKFNKTKRGETWDLLSELEYQNTKHNGLEGRASN